VVRLASFAVAWPRPVADRGDEVYAFDEDRVVCLTTTLPSI
jgi:hypothetical protein